MSKFSYLTDVVDYYANYLSDCPSHSLSDEQYEQLSEVRDDLNDFDLAGEPAAGQWIDLCDELLKR